MTALALVGAAGRMGTQILHVVDADPGVEVVAALVSKSSSAGSLGPGAVQATSDVADGVRRADVVIDFSSPAAFQTALEQCVSQRKAFVSGTTGLDAAQRGLLEEAAQTIPVLWAANFSVGVNVLGHLTTLAARALEGFDVEIFEAHHRHKVDAPSGTALYLGRAAASGRDADLEEVATWARHGNTGARSDDEIGFQVVRGGSIVGEHTVFLCGDGERIELTHRAQDRAIFARGAVRAAKWLVGKQPGSYAMSDVLFGSAPR